MVAPRIRSPSRSTSPSVTARSRTWGSPARHATRETSVLPDAPCTTRLRRLSATPGRRDSDETDVRDVVGSAVDALEAAPAAAAPASAKTMAIRVTPTSPSSAAEGAAALLQAGDLRGPS